MLPASGTCALNGQGIGAKLVGAALALNPQREPDLKQGVAVCSAVIELTLHTQLMSVAIPARAGGALRYAANATGGAVFRATGHSLRGIRLLQSLSQAELAGLGIPSLCAKSRHARSFGDRSEDDRVRLEAIVKERNHSHSTSSGRRSCCCRGPAGGGGGGQARRREPARGLALAVPLRRGGTTGLLRDKTRPPGTPPLPAETVARVVAMTCAEPPGAATHWTGRAMAKEAGISLSSVQRIWAEHDLQPHRIRTFKRSNDPALPEAPGHRRAVRRSAGAQPGAVGRRKSQIQALIAPSPACP